MCYEKSDILFKSGGLPYDYIYSKGQTMLHLSSSESNIKIIPHLVSTQLSCFLPHLFILLKTTVDRPNYCHSYCVFSTSGV